MGERVRLQKFSDLWDHWIQISPIGTMAQSILRGSSPLTITYTFNQEGGSGLGADHMCMKLDSGNQRISGYRVLPEPNQSKYRL
jgi:hypothetical protein